MVEYANGPVEAVESSFRRSERSRAMFAQLELLRDGRPLNHLQKEKPTIIPTIQPEHWLEGKGKARVSRDVTAGGCSRSRLKPGPSHSSRVFAPDWWFLGEARCSKQPPHI